MRLRNVKNKEEILNTSRNFLINPKEYRGKIRTLFNNDNPIYLEIGVGKCNFIYENAKKYKDINFIGIEKSDSVLALGIKKIEEELDNLILINYDASKIEELFDCEIDYLYLNFSDPWPKARHERRRLTSIDFLEKYDKIFRKEKNIALKTDNRTLFEYSLKTLSNYGYVIEDLSLDLHNSDISDNIMTEYEEKFSKLGYPIYMVKVFKN